MKPGRSPTARSPKDDSQVKRIASHLRARAAGFWLHTLVKFAIGIPLSLIGPTLLAFIFYAFLLRARVTWNPGWLNLFWISCGIILPILYILEWRTRGEYLVEEMRWQGTTADHFYSSNVGQWEARQDAATGAAYTEILLFAPRQVLGAISGIRQRVHISSAELQRASEIVRALHAADGGVPVSQLRRPDDTKESLAKIFRYLQFHDWIDVSAKGDRAWLITTARKRLKS